MTITQTKKTGLWSAFATALLVSGILSGTVCKNSAHRADLLFRADEWGWKGLFIAWNFQNPTAVRTRTLPDLGTRAEWPFRLLMLGDIIELFMDDQLVLSTCVAAFHGDFGHERLGVMDNGGAAAWDHLAFTPLAMSDAREFW